LNLATAGAEATNGAERRRRIRGTTLRVALFAVAVYVIFIVAMVSRGP
jgi:hypothetical protein